MRYQNLFEDAPVSLWEEDFSELAYYFKELKEKGVKDFRIYFNEKPSELQVCAKKIKIIDINKATQVLHQADSKDQLLDNLEKTFTEKRQ